MKPQSGEATRPGRNDCRKERGILAASTPIAGLAPLRSALYPIRQSKRHECRAPFSGRSKSGFTLIELLVVIAIIAVLAGLLLGALYKAKIAAQTRRAKLEISQIASAIHAYEAEYGTLPVSQDAIKAAFASGGDFTYGDVFNTPTGTFDTSTSAAGFKSRNSEVMAILLDLETFGDGTPTVNKGHAKNPQRIKFLELHMSGDYSSPGVGLDGVFRDPWGKAVNITLDLNNDEKARDTFYSSTNRSSQASNPDAGINGLILDPAKKFFEAGSRVMVWSAGPDKMIDPASKANTGANKDNVITWKQE